MLAASGPASWQAHAQPRGPVPTSVASSQHGPSAGAGGAFQTRRTPIAGPNPVGAPAPTPVQAPVQAPAPVPSDAELIAALQRGEDWAALGLYDRVQSQVVRTLSRLLRQRQSAELEDLMQTTFERMIRFLSQRSLVGAVNLQGWSRAVATNVAIDFLRREGAERRMFVPSDACLDQLRSSDAPAEASLDSRASLRRLEVIIAAMQPKYADTLILHDVLGHDLAEVADMTGASIAATQSRLVRGRKDFLRRAQREKKR